MFIHIVDNTRPKVHHEQRRMFIIGPCGFRVFTPLLQVAIIPLIEWRPHRAGNTKVEYLDGLKHIYNPSLPLLTNVKIKGSDTAKSRDLLADLMALDEIKLLGLS